MIKNSNWRIHFVLVVILSSFIIFCVSCEKKDDGPNLDMDKYPGTATAIMNGKQWSTHCGALDQFNGKFGIFADSLNGSFQPFNTLFIHKLDYQLDRVILRRLQTGVDSNSYATFRIIDYDVSLAYYILDTNSVNWIVFTELDTVNNVVKARFELDLVLEDGGVHGWPDKLSFKSGKISTKFAKL